MSTRWLGVMGECDTRTQGEEAEQVPDLRLVPAPFPVLLGRPRTKQRAAQRVQTARASSFQRPSERESMTTGIGRVVRRA